MSNMLTNKHLQISIIILGLLFTIKNSFGQQITGHINGEQFIVDDSCNKAKEITFTEFYRRVDRATRLLQTKRLSAIADSDHINIMMCLNTIFFLNHDKRFNNARYKKLLAVVHDKNYRHNISHIYTEWLFNRGMGQYYVKLKMELYGTPNLYATFAVTN